MQHGAGQVEHGDAVAVRCARAALRRRRVQRASIGDAALRRVARLRAARHASSARADVSTGCADSPTSVANRRADHACDRGTRAAAVERVRVVQQRSSDRLSDALAADPSCGRRPLSFPPVARSSGLPRRALVARLAHQQVEREAGEVVRDRFDVGSFSWMPILR